MGMDQRVLAASELTTFLQDLSTKSDGIQTPLYSVKASANRLSQHSSSLGGHGGESIRRYFQESYPPYVNLYRNLITAYKRVIDETISGLSDSGFDNSEHIDQRYLDDEFETEMKQKKQLTDEYESDINAVVSSYTDLVSLTNADFSDINSGIDDLITEKNDTIEKLANFDEKFHSRLQSLHEDLLLLRSYMETLRDKVGSGGISITNYESGTIKKEEVYGEVTSKVTQYRVDNFFHGSATFSGFMGDVDTAGQFVKLGAYGLTGLAFSSKYYGNSNFRAPVGGVFTQKVVDGSKAAARTVALGADKFNRNVVSPVKDFLTSDKVRGTATTAVKTAGRVFRVAEYVGVLSHVSELNDPRNSNNTGSQNAARFVGGAGTQLITVVGGGAGGAKVGAVIGSFICPGIGTVVGGVVGGLFGGIAGGLANDQFNEKVKDGAQKSCKISRR
ncbi:hypothetical protein JCM19045_3505 [Bacillus sp. JCM 19045]|nr:hypothetical protein JCM19045_3505 [Bacillus sp. JCM 19045]